VKLLLFDDDRVGVFADGKVVDVTAAVGEAVDGQARMVDVITGFAQYRSRIEEIVDGAEGVPVDEVSLRAPLPRPTNVLCAASNYGDRADGKVKPIDFFYKGGRSISGTGQVVEIPDFPEEATVFHAEPELGVVIGSPARHVAEGHGLSHVFGYLNFFDVSARGFPRERGTFLRKGVEGWAPIGPVLVTADEIPDPQNVRVRQWVNGELCQDFRTTDMLTSVSGLVEWLSRYITVMPGDVIGSGTHHINLTPINDGDRVEMEVEEFGRLEIMISSGGPRKEATWWESATGWDRPKPDELVTEAPQ